MRPPARRLLQARRYNRSRHRPPAIAATLRRNFVRPTRSAIVIAAGLAAAAALTPQFLPKDAPKPASLPPPEEAGELVVIIRPGPVVYYPGPNGTLAGLDVDLAREFAMEKKIPLRFVLADSAAAVIAAVASGRCAFRRGRAVPPAASDRGRCLRASNMGARSRARRNPKSPGRRALRRRSPSSSTTGTATSRPDGPISTAKRWPTATTTPDSRRRSPPRAPPTRRSRGSNLRRRPPGSSRRSPTER